MDKKEANYRLQTLRCCRNCNNSESITGLEYDDLVCLKLNGEEVDSLAICNEYTED